MNLTREFGGVDHRKATASGAGNDCVYLRRDLAALADSKSGAGLGVSRSGILALTRYARG